MSFFLFPSLSSSWSKVGDEEVLACCPGPPESPLVAALTLRRVAVWACSTEGETAEVGCVRFGTAKTEQRVVSAGVRESASVCFGGNGDWLGLAAGRRARAFRVVSREGDYVFERDEETHRARADDKSPLEKADLVPVASWSGLPTTLARISDSPFSVSSVAKKKAPLPKEEESDEEVIEEKKGLVSGLFAAFGSLFSYGDEEFPTDVLFGVDARGRVFDFADKLMDDEDNETNEITLGWERSSNYRLLDARFCAVSKDAAVALIATFVGDDDEAKYLGNWGQVEIAAAVLTRGQETLPKPLDALGIVSEKDPGSIASEREIAIAIQKKGADRFVTIAATRRGTVIVSELLLSNNQELALAGSLELPAAGSARCRDGVALCQDQVAASDDQLDCLSVWKSWPSKAEARHLLRVKHDKDNLRRRPLAWILGGHCLCVFDDLGRLQTQLFRSLLVPLARCDAGSIATLCGLDTITALVGGDNSTKDSSVPFALQRAPPARICRVSPVHGAALVASATGVGVVDSEDSSELDSSRRARDLSWASADDILVLWDDGYREDVVEVAIYKKRRRRYQRLAKISSIPSDVTRILDVFTTDVFIIVLGRSRGRTLVLRYSSSDKKFLQDDKKSFPTFPKGADLLSAFWQHQSVFLGLGQDGTLAALFHGEDAWHILSDPLSAVKSYRARVVDDQVLVVAFGGAPNSSEDSFWTWCSTQKAFLRAVATQRPVMDDDFSAPNLRCPASWTTGLEAAALVEAASPSKTVAAGVEARLRDVMALALKKHEEQKKQQEKQDDSEDEAAAREAVVFARECQRMVGTELIFAFDRDWVAKGLISRLRAACKKKDAFLEVRALLSLAASQRGGLASFLSVVARAGRPMTEPELSRLFWRPPKKTLKRRRWTLRRGRDTSSQQDIVSASCFLHRPPTAMFADCLAIGDRRLASEYLSLVAFEGFFDEHDLEVEREKNGAADKRRQVVLSRAATSLLAACFEARLRGDDAATTMGAEDDLLVQAWHFARRAESSLLLLKSDDSDDDDEVKITSTDDLAAKFVLEVLLKRRESLGVCASTLADLADYDATHSRARRLKRAPVDAGTLVEAALRAFPHRFLECHHEEEDQEEEDGLQRLYEVACAFDLDAWRLLLAAGIGIDSCLSEPPRRGLAMRFATAFRLQQKQPIKETVLAFLDDLHSKEANSARKAYVV